MRRRFVLFLPILALALMGGECEFKATSDTRLPPREQAGIATEPRGGLVVGVSAGDTSSASGDSGVASQRAVVEAALAVSVLELVELELDAASPSAGVLGPLDGLDVIQRPMAAQEVAVQEVEVASNPVPEPGGFFLFGIGLSLVAWLWRGPRLRARTRARVQGG